MTEGRPLAALLAEAERLPPERYVPILAEVADALCAAHAAHFVHRNLKPENILIVDRGRARECAKLLGFGIAKSIGDERAGDPAVLERGAVAHVPYVTIEGTFVGTPAYASPEQALGRLVDHRTDIYARPRRTSCVTF